MKKVKVDLFAGDMQDMWLNGRNELVVRPSLQEVKNREDILDAGHYFYGGASFLSPNTGEASHYILSAQESTLYGNPGDAKVNMFASQFFRFGELDYGRLRIREPLFLTGADINSPNTASLEFLLCAPDINPAYGFIGGGVQQAGKVESVNPGTSAIDVPRGTAANFSFGGRVVIGQQKIINISDVNAPRTFVGQNSGQVGGNIYGLVATTGGLCIGTDEGFYLLPDSAISSNQIVAGMFQKISDHRVFDYQKVCSFGETVFALTERGVININTGQEMSLDEKKTVRTLREPVINSDYRDFDIFAWSEGFVVSGLNRWYVYDVRRNFGSWWTFDNLADGEDVRILNVLEDDDGSSLFLTRYRILRMFGDVDFTETRPKGVVATSLVVPTEGQTQLRGLTVASDAASVTMACRSSQGTVRTPPQRGTNIIGSDLWGTGKYRSRELASVYSQFRVTSDDLSIEVEIEGSDRRIDRQATAELVLMRGRNR